MDAPTKESFALLSLPEQITRLDQVDAKTRQEFIFASRNSLTLTRALSSERLFYTLKEIGLTDAISVLALASPEQVRDMLDLDCWRKDRLDDRRLLTWLMLLDEASSGKLAEWFLHADIELLVLVVKRHLEVVRKADVEEDPDFNQSRYFTFDDQYLLRFFGEGEPILALLLERLRVLDYDVYKNVLEWSLFEFESALEEEALRWRNARLAERGYPEYDEALEVFRFVAPESLSLEPYRRATVPQVRFTDGEEVIPADHALMLLEVRDSLFVKALATLSSAELETIGQELATLTNQVVIAESCDPGEVAQVRRCAELVHDYINIGLAYLTHAEEAAARRLLQDTLLRPFFQAGVSLTLQLQQRLRALDTVLQRQVGERWEEYLDSPFRETCIGVRRRPPLFFRGLETPGEILYRRFRNLTEVRRGEHILIQIPLWFSVLRRLELVPERRTSENMTLGVFWQTAFVRWVVEGKVTLQPLTRAELQVVQKKLPGAAIAEKSAAFLAYVKAQYNLSAAEAEALQALAEFSREKVEEIVAIDGVATAELRFIEGVLVTA